MVTNDNRQVFDTGEEGIALNRLAREQMKSKLLNDILIDLQVCELEGLSKLEYLHELQDLINGFLKNEQ